MGIEDDQKKGERTAEAICPKCGSKVTIARVSHLATDDNGCEAYFIQCNDCKTWLTGIIDPDDDVFLLL